MQTPDWVLKLPAVNATLNGLATALLIAGYQLIRRRKIIAHRNVMLTAFATSIAFLACYLTYHFALHHYTGTGSHRFPADHPGRPVYLVILVTHVILAAAVPFLASVTIFRGLYRAPASHRRIARWTYPIWLYVSVTGVIIYWMLYHWAA